MRGVHKHLNPNVTPQTERAEPHQVKNNAGGYTFKLDPQKALERFLILGTDGGTYYANERKHTKQAFESVKAALKADYIGAINLIVDVSDKGRAPKNDPALLALAYAAGASDKEFKNAQEIRAYALAMLPKVARTATHLFHFVEYAQTFRGWGRGLKRAVGAWYSSKVASQLAYQVVKYRQRDGWTHRDLLRLSHPVPATGFDMQLENYSHNAVLDWVTHGTVDGVLTPGIIQYFEQIQKMKDSTPKQVASFIKTVSEVLPWEAVPTEFLAHAEVWEALLPNLPYTALIRNLGRLTSLGLLKPLSGNEQLVVSRLVNGDALRKARVHPLNLLIALRTYNQGRGDKGKLTWSPNANISSALEKAFYLSFGFVKPTGKRMMLGLDVSGSMGSPLSNLPITCREAAAVMAMVTNATEPRTYMVGFSHNLVDLPFQKTDTFEHVTNYLAGMSFGSTDCALPMIHALRAGIEVDTFVIYTDNETWYGAIHPHQALKQYRKKTGIDAKLIVVGMTATNFSIADPDDAGMMDVVGFDTSTPAVISAFSGEVEDIFS